jgi:hypothetical protein
VSASLLESVHGLLERTYRIRSGLDALAPFVIGDAGYRELYGDREVAARVSTPDGQGAMTLVRQTSDGVSVRVYFPDAMIRRLEAHPPQRGVGGRNLDAFATFVEEVDHLLVIAERSRRERPVSLFELELHANVSKFLVLARFLAGRAGRLTPSRRLWLRDRLFERPVIDDDPSVRDRYRDAARWGLRLIESLGARPAAERVRTLRSFHDAGVAAKLRLIDRVSRAS